MKLFKNRGLILGLLLCCQEIYSVGIWDRISSISSSITERLSNTNRTSAIVGAFVLGGVTTIAAYAAWSYLSPSSQLVPAQKAESISEGTITDLNLREKIAPIAQKTASLKEELRSMKREVSNHMQAISGELGRASNTLREMMTQYERNLLESQISLKHFQDIIHNPFFSASSPSGIYKSLSQALEQFRTIAPYTRENFTRDIDPKGATTTRYIITPHIVNSPYKILLKSVHGTWANDGEFGTDESAGLSKSLIVFAQQLALAYQAEVQLDIFRWTGELKIVARADAGIRLGNEIKQYIDGVKSSEKVPVVWVIAHSHGCNVTNNAAQHLKTFNVSSPGAGAASPIASGIYTIDNAIFLGSPLLDKDPLVGTSQDKSYNIKSILNFWADTDMTGSLGSFQTGYTTTLRKGHSEASGEAVRNITVKFNSYYLNHITIKLVVVRYLADILQTIGRKYPLNYDLLVNIYSQVEESAAAIATHVAAPRAPVTSVVPIQEYVQAVQKELQTEGGTSGGAAEASGIAEPTSAKPVLPIPAEGGQKAPEVCAPVSSGGILSWFTGAKDNKQQVAAVENAVGKVDAQLAARASEAEASAAPAAATPAPRVSSFIWLSEIAISNDDYALRIRADAAQYVRLLPRSILTIFQNSYAYNEEVRAAYRARYRGYEITQTPITGTSTMRCITSEVLGSVVLGDTWLTGILYN